MPHLWKRSAAVLLGLTLAGCASLRAPGPMPPTIERASTLSLRPALAGERQVQAVVNPYTAADIQRLDVVPYLEVAANVFQPISATTGAPTTESDPQLLKLSQSKPSINFNHAFTFTNLKPSHRYRIYARAYAAGGALLSTDTYSYAEVTLTNDDRPTLVPLPVRLIDRSFSGSTSVTVSNTGGSGYDQVVASLVKVVNGSETAVTSQTIARTSIPKTFQLTGLKANTTYRLKISARKSDATVVATALATVAVGTDDAPANQAIAFSAPALYTVGTHTRDAMAVPAPEGITCGRDGLVYVTNGYNGTVWMGVSPGILTQIASGLGYAAGVAVDGTGNVFVADLINGTLERIDSNRSRSTFVSGLTEPNDVAIDAAGNLYVADGSANCIRKVTPGKVVTPYASLPGAANGVAVDANGWVYASVPGSVLKIPPGGGGYSAMASVPNPFGLTVDAQGNVFAVSGQGLYQIPTGGSTATLVAGSANLLGFTDAVGLSARFSNPIGVTAAPDGTLYVADSGNKAIRQVVP